jgi:hypothetical protein
LELILIRVKEKMGNCVKDINELFYNRETSENDSKLCVLMQKILRLVSYLESTNEGNVLGRVAVDLKELCVFLFSPEKEEKSFFGEKVGRFLKLDNRQIYENILQNLGRAMPGQEHSEILMDSFGNKRDQVIDKFNHFYQENIFGRNLAINSEALLRKKLSRCKNEILVEIRSHMDAGFKKCDGVGENNYKYEFSDLDRKKSAMLEKFGKLKTLHNHLKNSFHWKLDNTRPNDSPYLNNFYSMSHVNSKYLYGNFLGPNLAASMPQPGLPTPDQIFHEDASFYLEKLSSTKPDNNNTLESKISDFVDKPRPIPAMDAEVSRVYNDILYDKFNPTKVRDLELNLTDLEYCISFERLVCSISGIYHQMKSIFGDLEYFKKDEKSYLVKISEGIIGSMVEGLENKFLYSMDLNEMVDAIFSEIESLCATEKSRIAAGEKKQVLARHESVQSKKENHSLVINNIRGNAVTKHIDVSINRFSQLIGLTISRLVLNSQPSTLFNAYSVEDSILQATRFALKNDNYSSEKHLTYFLNSAPDRAHPADFFKICVNTLKTDSSDEISVDMLELNYLSQKQDTETAKNYRFDTEELEKCKFRFNERYTRRVDVTFESSIEDYDLASKMCLAAYQIVYKTICINRETDYDLERRKNILITKDHLFEFLSFINYGPSTHKTNLTSREGYRPREHIWTSDYALTLEKENFLDYTKNLKNYQTEKVSGPFSAYDDVTESIMWGAKTSKIGNMKNLAEERTKIFLSSQNNEGA